MSATSKTFPTRYSTRLTLSADGARNAQVSVALADWDYTQQYPNSGQDVASGLTPDGFGSASGNLAASDDISSSGPQWRGDVAVQGSLTVHLTPVAQLGIVFNIPDVTIPNTVVRPVLAPSTWHGIIAVLCLSLKLTQWHSHMKVELGLDTYGTVYASAGASASNDAGTAEACFGAKIGYELYAQVTAP